MSQSTRAPIDREEIAKREIGHTELSRGMAIALTSFFLLVITLIPVGQPLWEKWNGETPQALSIVEAFPAATDELLREGGSARSLLDRVFDANDVLLQFIGSYESTLEDRSYLAEFFIPRMQWIYAAWLGLGNEKVYLGRDGWLFYRPGVDYLIGPGFLNEPFLKRRALAGDASEGEAVQPDPIVAILDFHQQLEDQGVHLILMPVPVKGVIEPEFLSGRYDEGGAFGPVQNPSYAHFLAVLRGNGVDVLDVTEALWENKQRTGRSQYLRTDTHWTPEAMEISASLLADRIRSAVAGFEAQSIDLRRDTVNIRGEGDIAAMLKLSPGSELYPRQKVEIHPVRDVSGKWWTPSDSAEILFLGDSFSNIYSLGPMGWGEAAGFVEQLSWHLQSPVDGILRNDAGAFATRELLAKEIAQGNDRLAGKKVLVWEFAMRELSVGDWKLVDIPESHTPENTADPVPGGFFVPDPGESVVVRGRIEMRSTVPRPGTVPYKDQVFAIHLTEITGDGVPLQSQAVVYLSGMIDNQLTEASRWKVGQEVKLRLTDWNEVAAQYERLNRSELDDFELQLEIPSWGEPIE